MYRALKSEEPHFKICFGYRHNIKIEYTFVQCFFPPVKIRVGITQTRGGGGPAREQYR